MKLKITENKQYLRVFEASEEEIKQLKISLTKKVKNYYFHPKVKRKIWDGSISFIDKYGRIPIGLWDIVHHIAQKYKYDIEIENLTEIFNLDFNEDDYKKWEMEFHKDSNKKPRDYQTQAVIDSLKWKRCMHQIATSAGKTLIIFNLFAYLKHIGLLGTQTITNTDENGNVTTNVITKKMVVVVPNIQLISQTLDKFEEYSKDKTKISYKAQLIFEGMDKTKKDADIIIGTYQSLRDMPTSFFDDTYVLCVDECHSAKTQSVRKIFEKCVSDIRIGLSGTAKIMEETADTYTIQGNLGPIVGNISSAYLFKNGYATPLRIKILYLDYLDEDIKQKLYQLRQKKNISKSKLLSVERELIINDKNRFEYIIKLIQKVQNNCLVLFHDIKHGYGKSIYERLLDDSPNDEEVYYVDGNTDIKNREYYKERFADDNHKKKTLVASFGTTAVGIDAPNIHWIFLVESYKSEIIIKQSLGRGMRLHESKTMLNIVDIVDDFSYGKSLNYIKKHAQARKEIYKNEEFPYKEYKINFQ